jgi:hypothetical protein
MNMPISQLKRGTRLKGLLAILTLGLAVSTIVWSTWIEGTSGTSPDGGNGRAEWAIVGGLAFVSLLFGAWTSLDLFRARRREVRIQNSVAEPYRAIATKSFAIDTFDTNGQVASSVGAVKHNVGNSHVGGGTATDRKATSQNRRQKENKSKARRLNQTTPNVAGSKIPSSPSQHFEPFVGE